MTKRTALCISGQYRNYIDTFPLLKKYIIDVFNPDIFLTTNNDDNQTEILNVYNPKAYTFDNDINHFPYNYTNCHASTKAVRMFNQFRRIYDCNQLKCAYETEHNFVYDLVMRIRFDAFFNRYFQDSEILDAENFILIPWGWNFTEVSSFAKTDIFAMGNSINMNKYSDLYLNLQQYEQQCILHPESLMGYNLQSHNISTKEFIINFQFFVSEFDIRSVNNRDDYHTDNTGKETRFFYIKR